MRASLPESQMGFPRDFDHCHQVIKAGSKSFHMASLLLPKHVRRAAFATYAFCRAADDAVDLGSDPSQAVKTLSERLDQIYDGRPKDHPIDRAFASVVSNYQLPRALPDGLLEGMLWDVQNRRYQTLEDLLDYAARVAGTVGAMMTLLMGNPSRLALARATDLGLAMQLSNIARDIGEDARAGRLYLPETWLLEEGVDPAAFLRAPTFDPRLARLTKRLLDAAEPMYARGLTGVDLLPPACRTSIRAAGKIYREIGEEIRRNQYNSISQRAFVSKARKLQLLAGSMFAKGLRPESSPELPASGFLVDAAASEPGNVRSPAPQTRALWVLDLFTRLEVRDQAQRVTR